MFSLHLRSVLLAVVTLPACGGGVVDNFGQETKSFDAFDSVRVVAETGRVTVTAGDEGAIDVTYIQNNANERWQDSEDGGTLVIEGTCSDGAVGCSAGFRLDVPPGTNVSIVTTEGDIELEGPLQGSFDLETVSGALIGTGLSGADVDVLTNSSVELRFVAPPNGLDIDGGRSAIYVEIPPGEYDLQIDAGGAKNIDDGITSSPAGPPIILQCVSDITVATP